MLDIDHKPSLGELRWFGAVLPVALVIIGSMIAHMIGWPPVRIGAIALAIVLCLVYYLAPPTRLPIYRTWRYVQMPIAFVVWHTALALLFYLVMTPIALVMRRFGRDPLNLRLEPSRVSYWEAHVTPIEAERYFRMY